MSKASTLAQRLLKNSKLDKGTSAMIADSKVYTESEVISTEYPVLNASFSGSLNGGYIDKDITIFAGPSKHGKTFLTFVCAKAFQDKYPDGVIMFYDSEFGTPKEYMQGIGIDMDRVIHNPITNLEELKFDIVHQMESLERGDKVLFLIDSLTNTPSKKELVDALNEKSVADMTRAKEAKALFRMVTPLVAKKNCPLFVISHTYDSMEMFSRKIVSGGCLTKGHNVITIDGIKDISEMEVGDMVLTHTGNYKPVTHVWDDSNLDPSEFCYEVEFEDGHKITCSERHRLYVNDKWVHVRDLKDGIIIDLDDKCRVKHVKKVEKVELQPLYDITVEDDNSYTTDDGLVHHNTGAYYAASNIFIMGRQQIKTGSEITGWKFVINIEKSRSVKEKLKFELEVDEHEGINKFSGLLDLACEFGFVVKPSNGWYSKVDMETGEVEDKKYRAKETMCDEFWEDILKNPDFDEAIKRKYKYQYNG